MVPRSRRHATSVDFYAYDRPKRPYNRGKVAVAALHPDLDSALGEILASTDDQTAEFKRRLRKLVENATTSNLGDDDVREVIELVSVAPELEE